MFHVSVVNRTRTVADLEMHRVVRAINRQIVEDFEPYWAFGGRLRVEGPAGRRLDPEALREMRGDAVIYVVDSASSDDYLGYHAQNLGGIPYGFVYLDLCAKLGDVWSTTLSHEALELIADPLCNLLVQGPNPKDPSAPQVFHYFEMCDAVQSQGYEIDGVPVSNFVLPAYFTPNETEGTRRDFNGTTLRSFGANPGGYIGFFDPALVSANGGDGSDTFFPDQRSRERYLLKSAGALPLSARPLGRVARRMGSAQPVSRFERPSSREFLAESAALADPALGDRRLQGLPDASDPIRHVVVLMLENRSFDQMLGGLQGAIPGLDGVNPASPGSNTFQKKKYAQQPDAMPWVSGDFKVPHEAADVALQMSDSMGNFVNSFVQHNPKSPETQRQQVMSYFADGSLPILHALAKNYLVCNRWFSSLPGPTWPNRFFVHSGTSLGRALMPDADNPAEIASVWGTYDQPTIYDRLDEAARPVSWKIYHDGFPQSVILDHLKVPFLKGRYGDMKDFFEDAKVEAVFPAYSFIEPRYLRSLTAKVNDQHAPADVADGEKLTASIYDAIRSNPALWRSTLLIVTYDEHGGFYDHVVPPGAIPPDDSPCDTPVAFDRLGVRVPTVLVSPYVAKGRCDDTTYDHTSILRFVLEKYRLQPLGARTVPSSSPLCVGNFASVIQPVARPDEDTLAPFGLKPGAPAARASRANNASDADTDPDNGQRALLAIAERMRFLGEVKSNLFGARMAAAAAVAATLPPTAAAEFRQRVTSLDQWLSGYRRSARSEPLLNSLEVESQPIATVNESAARPRHRAGQSVPPSASRRTQPVPLVKKPAAAKSAARSGKVGPTGTRRRAG